MLILALLLVASLPLHAQHTAAQENPTRKTENVDWDALTPKIKALLSGGLGCDGPEMYVSDDSDVTGDGTPLALVECGMGAPTWIL